MPGEQAFCQVAGARGGLQEDQAGDGSMQYSAGQVEGQGHDPPRVVVPLRVGAVPVEGCAAGKGLAASMTCRPSIVQLRRCRNEVVPGDCARQLPFLGLCSRQGLGLRHRYPEHWTRQGKRLHLS